MLQYLKYQTDILRQSNTIDLKFKVIIILKLNMPNLLQWFITVLQIKHFQLAGDFELTPMGIYVFQVNNRNNRHVQI